jgi:Fe2+ transport system protein B
MPENTTDTTDGTATTETVETDDSTTTQWDELPADHPLVKTLAKQKEDLREQRARNAALAEKARKLDEIEQANKSEAEKLAERAAQAEARATALETAAIRNQIALERGLTPTQAKRLMGATREELEADADELLADLKASRPSAAASADGQGRQGEPVGSAKQITSRDQLGSMTSQERLAAYRDGRLDGLMGKS